MKRKITLTLIEMLAVLAAVQILTVIFLDQDVDRESTMHGYEQITVHLPNNRQVTIFARDDGTAMTCYEDHNESEKYYIFGYCWDSPDLYGHEIKDIKDPDIIPLGYVLFKDGEYDDQMQRLISGIGGVEIILGGIQIVNPMLVDAWVGWIVIAMGFLTLTLAFFWPLSIPNLRWEKTVGTKDRWRVPLVEIIKQADARGWNFSSNGGLPALDFAHALRQAGRDKTLRFWGKPMQSMQTLTRAEILEEISPDHWSDHKIDGVRLLRHSTSGQVVGFIEDNMKTQTDTIPQSSHHGCYADIHVDKKAALRWLKKDANEHKGMYEELDGHW